jgi:hypothetical protein
MRTWIIRRNASLKAARGILHRTLRIFENKVTKLDRKNFLSVNPLFSKGKEKEKVIFKGFTFLRRALAEADSSLKCAVKANVADIISTCKSEHAVAKPPSVRPSTFPVD